MRCRERLFQIHGSNRSEISPATDRNSETPWRRNPGHQRRGQIGRASDHSGRKLNSDRGPQRGRQPSVQVQSVHQDGFAGRSRPTGPRREERGQASWLGTYDGARRRKQ